MLERVYKQIDITPDHYPFLKSASANVYSRNVFPSNQWESNAKSDYKMYFTPGPPPKFPEVKLKENERANKPHARSMFVPNDSKGNKWNAKTTIYGEPDVYETPVGTSDYKESYARKMASKREKKSSWITRQSNPATSIIPGYDNTEAVNDRVLPACGRDRAVALTTTPFLQYTGKKKRLAAPFADGGVFYEGEQGAKAPAVEPNYWNSVMSLGGKGFSRRKPVRGPSDTLKVDEFDGGAPAKDYSRWDGGMRTGYSLAHATMHRPE